MTKLLEKMPYYIETSSKLKPYWDGLNAGEFKTTRCKKCEDIHFPPRTLCSKCYSTDLEWINLPLAGVLESFTLVSIPPPGFSGAYYLAEVRVDVLNKPILGRLYNDNEPKIGDKVILSFEDIDPSQSVIVFRYK
jgi:uncharacterized OB-fold protein